MASNIYGREYSRAGDAEPKRHIAICVAGSAGRVLSRPPKMARRADELEKDGLQSCIGRRPQGELLSNYAKDAEDSRSN
jgi:hypothetical protein